MYSNISLNRLEMGLSSTFLRYLITNTRSSKTAWQGWVKKRQPISEEELRKAISEKIDELQEEDLTNLSTIITNNVKEALILEQNLIKKYQPRFNVLLKDSGYYPYLEITSGANPRYQVVRKINPTSQSEYFGPLPDGSKAREILQLLERLFPLAKCKGAGEPASDPAQIKKACLIHYQKYSPAELPDLIIVDGGKEQVKAVQQALKELKMETLVIGLVKDEKHKTAKIITNDCQELEFGRNERVKNFFTNCQEEVHRYAINFHRKLHRKSILKTN
ncbi:2761_t:CDS:2 [Ambispora gerdemannii]|uniref:2761_t:CDS:1 n=1 Tax=Ambispora gerdemannii TaxID=144530 RepID=A0A9N9C8V7_9GLOM|nr:2761_t:CDS:2 [Ambispora gerdemannii]